MSTKTLMQLSVVILLAVSSISGSSVVASNNERQPIFKGTAKNAATVMASANPVGLAVLLTIGFATFAIGSAVIIPTVAAASVSGSAAAAAGSAAVAAGGSGGAVVGASAGAAVGSVVGDLVASGTSTLSSTFIIFDKK